MLKNKKIILVIPPYKESKKGHLPLLSIGYIAAYLERGGYEVKIIDAIALNFGEDETVDLILKENPDAVGITTVTSSRFSAIKIIKLLRKKNKDLLIFAGGRHFHSTAKESLEDILELDVIVRGEGEETCLEFLNGYFDGKNLSEIRGLALRQDGKIIFTLERDAINLDEIPMPAWHLFDLSLYNQTLEVEKKTKAIGVISSRGCPNNCVFCANNSFLRTLRLLSPVKFVDQIEFLNKKYGYTGFDIWDDTLTMSRKHILGICEEIIKRNLKIIWYARARVNTVDYEVLKKMKEAGCKIIGYGIESGSEKILKEIKKNITIKQVKDAVRLSAKLGFITKCWFIYGLPTENLEDIKKTRKLMRQIKNCGARYGAKILNFANFPLLYPGTPLTESAMQENIFPRDFRWSNEIFLEKNKKFGNDLTIPLYESRALKVDKIIEFNKKYDRKISELFLEFIYQIRQIKNFETFRNFVKRFFKFIHFVK